MPDDKNKLVYNGTDLRTYGLYVSGDKTFNSPRKEYTKVSIPGRSGDLVIFDGRYSNVTLKYDAILISNYEENAANLRATLLSPDGYVRIEDCYHPDEYRMGVFEGPLDFDSVFLQAGVCTLQFNCQPQRWLKNGERWTQYSPGNTVVNNPTVFEAKPVIYVQGVGRIKFSFYKGGEGFFTDEYKRSEFTLVAPSPTWAQNFTTYEIDCETMNVRNGALMHAGTTTWFYPNDSVNANEFIEIDQFPTLIPGNNGIQITANGQIGNVIIRHRWYIL